MKTLSRLGGHFVKKNYKVFWASELFFTVVIFFMLYSLLTRHGEPVAFADGFMLLLISVLFGVFFSFIYFCLARKEAVADLMHAFFACLFSWNRKQGSGASFNKHRSKEPIFPRYYLKIDKDHYELRDVSSAVRDAGLTKVVVDSDGIIVAVGDPESIGKVESLIAEHAIYGRSINWFDEHKRTITDAGAGEAALRYSIARLSRQFFFAFSPCIIFHIVNKAGYSPMEIALIQDLGKKAGVKDVYIWNGGELSDYEIFSGEIFDDGWVAQRPYWLKDYLRKQGEKAGP